LLIFDARLPKIVVRFLVLSAVCAKGWRASFFSAPFA
jgi:hypothetical protein